jgi:hypothetical protein
MELSDVLWLLFSLQNVVTIGSRDKKFHILLEELSCVLFFKKEFEIDVSLPRELLKKFTR